MKTQNSVKNHISDHDLDRYYLGRFRERSELLSVEQHFIRCEYCKERIKESANYVAAMRAVLGSRPNVAHLIEHFMNERAVLNEVILLLESLVGDRSGRPKLVAKTRRRGRPPGSKNKRKALVAQLQTQDIHAVVANE